MSDDGEDDFATILRRNTYSRFSKDLENNNENSERIVFSTPIPRPSSAENRISSGSSTKLNPKAFTTLNSFNDMGHLSRRVFNDKGENHLNNSDDFENSFGYRKVFDNRLEVTAITATTIATCLSDILLELIVEGEKLAESGHFNCPEYDIFCGGGKNLRARPVLKSEASIESNIHHVSSKSNLSSKSSASKSNPSLSPKPGRKALLKQYTLDTVPTAQQISNFVAKLCNDTQMEYECIIISLIYVRRLIKKSEGKLVMLQENWKGIILSCIVLANKVWDDFHMQNLDYCYVFNGLTVQRVNALELQLLISLDNRCNVSPSAYAQTHFEIQSMITLANIENEKKTKKKRFSSKFSKIHAEPELEDETALPNITPDRTTPHSSGRIQHPSPYGSFKNDGDDNHSKRACDEVESSTRLSASDDYIIGQIPAPLFTDGGDIEQETPSERKKIIVQATDLENQKQNLRVMMQYDDESIIKSPCSTATTNTGRRSVGGSVLNKGKSLKSLTYSRKSFRGGPGSVLSPLPPDEKKKVTSRWLCFTFSCFGTKDEII